MLMHISRRIFYGVVFAGFKARTVGNQIHADHSGIDFAPASFKEEDLKAIEAKVNGILAKGVAVTVREEDRNSLENRLITENGTGLHHGYFWLCEENLDKNICLEVNKFIYNMI